MKHRSEIGCSFDCHERHPIYLKRIRERLQSRLTASTDSRRRHYKRHCLHYDPLHSKSQCRHQRTWVENTRGQTTDTATRATPHSPVVLSPLRPQSPSTTRRLSQRYYGAHHRGDSLPKLRLMGTQSFDTRNRMEDPINVSSQHEDGWRKRT